MVTSFLSSGFLLCPKCLHASPDHSIDTRRYQCPLCKHKWDIPTSALGDVYLGSLSDVEVCLVDSVGKSCLVGNLPATIGRETTEILSRKIRISRKHVRLGYSDEQKNFWIESLTENSVTRVQGRNLAKGEQSFLGTELTFCLGDEVVRVECRFKEVRDIQRTDSNDKSRPAIELPKDGIHYLNEEEGKRLSFSLQKKPESIAALNALNMTLYALDKEAILLENRAFIDHVLHDGDHLCIKRHRYFYSDERKKFLPDLEEKAKGVDIYLNDLQVKYGKHIVLNGVTCSMEPGKITAIVGRSGCGKTTLFKVLSGNKQASGGKISLRGTNVERYENWVNEPGQVALVPQNDIVHGELTVGQCVGYAVEMLPGKHNEREAVVSTVLREMDLEPFRNQEIDQLSGGQRKRVNIAVEIVGNPQLLLLDEPTTGLDFATEKQIIGILRKMALRGLTVVCVTHSLEVIKAADHVILLDKRNDGKGAHVDVEGKPKEVLRQKGLDTFEELYETLNKETVPSADQPTKQAKRVPLLPVLFSRYVSIWLNSPVLSAVSFLGIPLVLGIAISIATTDDLRRALLGLVAMLWIGMNQTVREIVREKSIFLHEHNNSWYSIRYLLSKVLFYIILSLPQALLVLLFIYCFDFSGYEGIFHKTQLPFFGEWLCLVAAGVVGGILGLLISSVCLFCRQKGEVVAVLLSVLLTLPQILFSDQVLQGGLFDDRVKEENYYDFTLEGRYDRPARFCSFLTLSRYLYVPLKCNTDNSHNPNKGIILHKAERFNGAILGGAALIMLVLSFAVLEGYVEWNRRKEN